MPLNLDSVGYNDKIAIDLLSFIIITNCRVYLFFALTWNFFMKIKDNII